MKPTICVHCHKHTYGSQMRALAASLRSSRSFGKGMRAYRCPAGNGFHLTSQRKRK